MKNQQQETIRRCKPAIFVSPALHKSMTAPLLRRVLASHRDMDSLPCSFSEAHVNPFYVVTSAAGTVTMVLTPRDYAKYGKQMIFRELSSATA